MTGRPGRVCSVAHRSRALPAFAIAAAPWTFGQGRDHRQPV